MTTAAKELAAYFPTKEMAPPEEEPTKTANEWTVINCHIDELASRLRKLPPGRKQVEVARWEDQVTVVINDLDATI